MIYHDYIITKKINLDLVKLKQSCYQMSNLIDRKFNNASALQGYTDSSGKSPVTTNLFSSYNLLMYPFDELHELYEEIKAFFHECSVTEEKYYIQCWLNIYKSGSFIDWHNHWLPKDNTWHGFFCVDCEPSKTTYRIPGVMEPVDIVSENNLLVMSRSNGDTHRTWPWEPTDRDRITIAFDIVPKNNVNPEAWLNHWLPI